jgi:hypothetical protein
VKSTFKNTSFDKGFGIFRKLVEETFDVTNSNSLRLFMLNTENKQFNYDELYEYVLSNLTRYAFDRRKVSEAESDSSKQTSIVLEALSQLRSIKDNADKGAGGELGEILLYLFLEQDLQAPKLLSKIELKTSREEYVKGSDGVHFKFRTDANGRKILQLVIGEAKIQNSLENAIKSAFESIKTYLTTNTQDRTLLDTHLMNQLVDPDEAAEIRSYVLEIPRKKRETVFGIFLGYSIEYDGSNDKNDDYDKNVVEANEKQVMALKDIIISQINLHDISNYEFNFYFLPFHNAMTDRRDIMLKITSGQPHFTVGGGNP